MENSTRVFFRNVIALLLSFQLNASDEDVGENARLSYELVADADRPRPLDDDDDDDDDVDVWPLFAVDADTGVVTAVAPLNRETSPQHRFQVRHLITTVNNNNNKNQSNLAKDGIAMGSPPKSSFVFARW